MSRATKVVLAIGAGVIVYSLVKGKTEVQAMAGSSTFLGLAKKYGAKHGIGALTILAIMKVESNFKVFASHANADGTVDRGLMQINSINLAFAGADENTIFDPDINIETGARLLEQKNAYLKEHGGTSLRKLISAYNQGEGRVARSGILNLAYVTSVLYWIGVYKLWGLDK